jgi:hypothetical protein
MKNYIVDAVVGGLATVLEIQADNASEALDKVNQTYGYSTFITNIVEQTDNVQEDSQDDANRSD